jgi:hypothetical protein
MAPQLRGRVAPASPGRPAPEPEEGAAAPRDPDTVRATMAAFQDGWTRGRHGDPERKESSS